MNHPLNPGLLLRNPLLLLFSAVICLIHKEWFVKTERTIKECRSDFCDQFENPMLRVRPLPAESLVFVKTPVYAVLV